MRVHTSTRVLLPLHYSVLYSNHRTVYKLERERHFRARAMVLTFLS